MHFLQPLAREGSVGLRPSAVKVRPLLMSFFGPRRYQTPGEAKAYQRSGLREIFLAINASADRDTTDDTTPAPH
jgi:hypothetical protein